MGKEVKQQESLESRCEKLRKAIKEICNIVKIMAEDKFFDDEEEHHIEMQTDITFALHHLQDARMRLGRFKWQIQVKPI